MSETEPFLYYKRPTPQVTYGGIKGNLTVVLP